MSKKYAIYFFPVLFWLICYFGFLFDGLYGQDAYEYFRFTKSLHDYFTFEKLPGDYFWGVYYPFLGSLLMFIVGKTPIALQFISLFSLIISSIYLDKIVELIYKEKTNSILIFLVFCISPIMLIHSVLVMSDILTCCLFIVAFYHYLAYLEHCKSKSFLFGVSFCLLAILTRYAIGLILLAITIIVFLKLLKNKHYKLLLYSIPIVAVIILPHILIKTQNSLEFLSHSWLQNWNILNLFKSNFSSIDGGYSQNHFPNIIYICYTFLHPIYMVFGVGIIAYSFKNKFQKLNNYPTLILISILVFSLFIGGIPYQNKRYLLPSFALIIILIYPQLRNIGLYFKNKWTFYLAVFLIQIALAFYFGKQFFDRNTLERNIVEEMKPYQGNSLYVFDIDVAMQGRELAFNYHNLFLKKYATFEKNAFVLVNEKNLEQQWLGKNPYINWNKLKNNYELKKMKQINTDWTLYQIKTATK